MDAKDIAKSLEEIAFLLEIKGENPFKIRAYANAAQILARLDIELETFLELAKKGKVKGIGEQLTDKIKRLYETNTLPYLDRLRAEFPEGLLELLSLPGLGVKKIKIIYQELGIDSVQALRNACQEKRLSQAKGFGKKSEEGILESIRQYEGYRGQALYASAHRLGNTVLENLMASGLCSRAEIVGDFRRKTETVKRIEILATSSNPNALIQAFLNIPEVVSVIEEDSKSASVMLKRRVAARLSVVPENTFSLSLIFRTGSLEHVAELCSLAESKGLVLTESDFSDGKERLSASSELEIYEKLGLCFLEPEVRENHGEILLGKECFDNKTKFQELIQEQDIQGIIHAHTTYSDGINTLGHLALEVKNQGYSYLGVSDHSQSAVYAHGLTEEEIERQHDEIDSLNDTLAPFKILKGIESEILTDGSLDYPEKVLERFDFVVASVHSRFHMNRDEMTRRVVRAIENPFTSMIGHPTGRLLLKRKAYDIDLEAVIETAARNNVAIEINSNPRRLDLDWRYFRQARQLGVKLFICPDAHGIKGLSDIRFGVNVARKAWLTRNDIMNCGSLAEVEQFFLAQRN